MINQISDWVVTEACRQSRAWRDQGVRVGVSVNLPPILWQPAMAGGFAARCQTQA